MNMKRRDFLIGAAGSAALLGCVKDDYRRASIEEVRNAFYHHEGPSYITLLSMVATSNDVSEHSGLLISGDQRVLYDPAGSYDPSEQTGWYAPPRKYDIHYGMNNLAVAQYERFHARLGYYVLRQTVEVPLSVANLAIRLSEEKGETFQTQCASSVSWVLKQLPGFEAVGQTMLPNKIREDFIRIPNVQTSTFRENDVGQNYETANLTVGNPDDIAPPPKPEYNRG